MLVDAVRRGRARELRGDLDRMISVSSDEAANRVIAALGGGSLEAGGASITDTLNDLGLERSLVRRGYVLTDRRPIPIEATNAPALATNFITTPFELGRLMVAIHRGAIPRGGIGRLGIGRKEARREVLGRLLRVLDRTKLAQGVPSDVPLAHKSGFTRHVRHDAGLIYVKSGPIVAVGMSWNDSGVSHTAGTRFLSKVRTLRRAPARRWGRLQWDPASGEALARSATPDQGVGTFGEEAVRALVLGMKDAKGLVVRGGEFIRAQLTSGRSPGRVMLLEFGEELLG